MPSHDIPSDPAQLLNLNADLVVADPVIVAAGFIPFSDPNKLYCICRQPETFDMIGCDSCEDWFHAPCFNINLAEIEDIANFPFSCPDCKKVAEQRDSSSEKSLTKRRQIKEKAKMELVAQKSVPRTDPSPQNEANSSDDDLVATESLNL
jgi:hypothetical protein